MNQMDEVELVKSTEIFKNCKNIVIGKGNLKGEILSQLKPNYFLVLR